jgi:hypothetical protein
MVRPARAAPLALRQPAQQGRGGGILDQQQLHTKCAKHRA